MPHAAPDAPETAQPVPGDVVDVEAAWMMPCALLTKDLSSVIIWDRKFEPRTGSIEVRLCRSKSVRERPWMGLQLLFPFDPSQSISENDGHGACYMRKCFLHATVFCFPALHIAVNVSSFNMEAPS